MKKITLFVASLITSFVFSQGAVSVSLSSTQGSLPKLQRDTDITEPFSEGGFGIAQDSPAKDLIITISNMVFQSPTSSFTFFLPIRNGEFAIGENIGSGNVANIAETEVDVNNSVLQGDGTYTFTMNLAPILLNDTTPVSGSKVSAAMNSFNINGALNNEAWTNNLSLGSFDVVANSDDVLSNFKFSKAKIDGFYSTKRNAIILSNHIDGNYKIFNLLGQPVQQAKKVSSEIFVGNLKSGVYILTTNYGVLKFVK